MNNLKASQQFYPELEPFEYIHPEKGGYFAILTKSKDDSRGKQICYPVSKLYDVLLNEIDPTNDVWISQLQFSKPCRQKRYLSSIGLLFVDLDIYKSKLFYPQFPVDSKDHPIVPVGEEIKNPILIKNLLFYWWRELNLNIPFPSLIIHSGRGLQLKWILETPLPGVAKPRWDLMQNILTDKLLPLGADHKSKDSSRVLRLVHTKNRKNGAYSYLLHRETNKKDETKKFNFDVLADEIFPISREELEAQRKERKQNRKNKQNKNDISLYSKSESYNKGKKLPLNSRKLAWDRYQDLRTLAKIRNGIKEGDRAHCLLFSLCFLAHSGSLNADNFFTKAISIAKEIDPTWYHDEYYKEDFKTIYNKAIDFFNGERIRYKGKYYPPLYTPKNTTLIRYFHITEEEQKKLKTIIGKNEKQRRNTEAKKVKRRSAGMIPRSEYLNRKNEKQELSCLLKIRGIRRNSIASVIKCSVRSVSSYMVDLEQYRRKFKDSQSQLQRIKELFFKLEIDEKQVNEILGAMCVPTS